MGSPPDFTWDTSPCLASLFVRREDLFHTLLRSAETRLHFKVEVLLRDFRGKVFPKGSF